MREILISIQPQWVEKILNGEKTIEIRKTMPKCELPCKVYIYCTKGKNSLIGITRKGEELPYSDGQIADKDVFYTIPKTPIERWRELGKVVAEFTLNSIDIIPTVKEKKNGASYQYHIVSEDILNKSCLKQEEILEYTNGKDLYAWHIDNLKIYDKPKDLSEFREPDFYRDCQKECNDMERMRCSTQDSHKVDIRCGWCRRKGKTLTRPPQSWCYIEKVEE